MTTNRPTVGERRRMSKRAALRLLDDVDAQARHSSIYMSADTLAERDFRHLLPESEPERALASAAIDAAADSDTGLAVCMSAESAVSIRPPLPIAADSASSRADSGPLRAILASEPVVGVIMLRLGRYAVC